jgi:Flp pilus assembly protein TadG
VRHSLRFRRDDRGVVALELVIAMPVLLMLIIGTVVLGNFLSIKTQTAGLARDGARAAALNLTLPTETTIVAGECNPPVAATDTVSVRATKTVTLRSFPLVPVNFLPATTTETVTMRCGG